MRTLTAPQALAALLVGLGASGVAAAQPAGYDKPPEPLLGALHAPSTPSPSVSPTGERLILVSWVDYPPMARVAEPFVKLAGVRVEPRNRSRHNTPGGEGIRPCARDYLLVTVATGAETKVALPPDACPGSPIWNADGTLYAFTNTTGTAVELWLGDATGKVRQVPGVRLNSMFGFTVGWLADQKSLLVKLVPDGQGPPPPTPRVPPGPNIQDTSGAGESSTYETRDTLKTPHDEDLFDYYGASQLAVIEAATGAVKPVGKPAIYGDVVAAPDGRHVFAEALHKPYSYVTTADNFPREALVLNLAGGEPHTVASLPLHDRVPVRGVPTGPRGFSWRATEPATLIWTEALDGGDWKTQVKDRDKVMLQRAPFTAAPIELLRTQQRFVGVRWGTNAHVAFFYEYDENKHWVRTFLVDVDNRKKAPVLLWDMSSDEQYKDPGNPVMRVLANGEAVIRQDGDDIYLSGTGASPVGNRPFLDRFNLKTRKTERLFRSDASAYETAYAFASPTPRENRFLTRHQSAKDPPNIFVRTLGKRIPGAAAGEAQVESSAVAVTHIADPAPLVRQLKKRLVKYKRADGVDLSFTLITPPGYQEGTRVPAILYAYPLDYAGAGQAGQVSGSEQYFERLRDYSLLALAGYAIIDDAAFPIVGDPQKAYDTYIEQLVADAKAAVDKAVELGVVDPERIGVTGHSHGALMTANLLAHSDLFRAGIATSGAYNKTLTPFGFQSERRSVWAAQSVYLRASPFFFADKIKAPILIIHGEDDANPGTTPLQATTFYQAVRGNGGTARLVMLPHEPHWYSAIESNEQEVAEMLRWFDTYVKNAAPRTSKN